jgi:hypothetical protein
MYFIVKVSSKNSWIGMLHVHVTMYIVSLYQNWLVPRFPRTPRTADKSRESIRHRLSDAEPREKPQFKRNESAVTGLPNQRNYLQTNDEILRWIYVDEGTRKSQSIRLTILNYYWPGESISKDTQWDRDLSANGVRYRQITRSSVIQSRISAG